MIFLKEFRLKVCDSGIKLSCLISVLSQFIFMWKLLKTSSEIAMLKFYKNYEDMHIYEYVSLTIILLLEIWLSLSYLELYQSMERVFF